MSFEFMSYNTDLILKTGLRIVLYSIIIYVTLSIMFFYLYVRPSRYVSDWTPKTFGLYFENVVLTTEDGIKLAGWFIPNKTTKKAIIVCHGYPADKGNVLGFASFLAKDFNLLLFDFRALGESKGGFSTGGFMEVRDFTAAVNFLKEKGFKDIGAFGFSLGGAVILMANSPDIKAIVSDSAYKDLDSVLDIIFKYFGPFGRPFIWFMKLFGKIMFNLDTSKVSPVNTISQIKVPVFLIHCENDSQIPSENSRILHSKKPDSLLWIIPFGDHGQGYALMTNEYEEKVLKFFKNNL